MLFNRLDVESTAPQAPDFGEYGGVIETMKKFTEFITQLIQRIVEFFKKLMGKKDDTENEK